MKYIMLSKSRITFLIRIIQFIYSLPVFILVWSFYIIPLWLLGKIKYVKSPAFLTAEFHVVKSDGWYYRLWRDWCGWAGPSVIILRTDGRCKKIEIKIRIHELTHVIQQFTWGPLFYPAYFLASIFIWIFLKEKHSYYDNPFERQARRLAGQVVDIPKERWRDGENDRWIWW